MRMIPMTNTKPGLVFTSLRLLILVAITVWIGCSPPPVSREDVPESLLSRFKAIYPNAESALWEKGEGVYTVTFEYSGSKLAVDFLPDGAVERTKMYIDKSALPATTLAFLDTTLPGQVPRSRHKERKPHQKTHRGIPESRRP